MASAYATRQGGFDNRHIAAGVANNGPECGAIFHSVFDAETHLEWLTGKITALVDVDMRVAIVRIELLRLSPDEAVEFFVAVVSSAESKLPDRDQLLLAVSLAIQHEELIEFRAEVAKVASERGFFDVARRVEIVVDENAQRDANAIARNSSGKPLSLGERKALARRVDRTMIARIIRDPEPVVVRILLGNPGLTEDDVVRLCARRPISGEVLREVFRATKWILRPRVRLTLVKNPYSPLDLALAIAPLLPIHEAREVARSPELDLVLRELCERISKPGTVH